MRARLLLALMLLPAVVSAHPEWSHRLERLNRLLERQPNHVEHRLARAGVYRSLGRLDEALADCDHARRFAIDPAATDALQGRILVEAKQAEAAIPYLDRAVQGDPAARVWRARALVDLDRLEEAVVDYSVAIDTAARPGPALWLERAAAERALGRFEAAVRGLADGLRTIGPAASLVSRYEEWSGQPWVAAAPVEDGASAQPVSPRKASTILVDFGFAMSYLDNRQDPGLGLTWVEAGFVPGPGWSNGTYGVGYGAGPINQTTVPDSTRSVYTRIAFTIDDLGAVNTLHLGVDYDDGFVAWINGVEVARAAEMPNGDPVWNIAPSSHESSNGPNPVFAPRIDVSAASIPALVQGSNVLAIGGWNRSAGSSDLALVPQLTLNLPLEVVRGPYLQSGKPTGVVVKWRTEIAVESCVTYGTTLGNLTTSVVIVGDRLDHEVELSGLAPDTIYYYTVGVPGTPLVGDDPDHFFLTSPTAGSAKPTRIWVLGDSGTANANAAAVRDGYLAYNGATHTDLWMMLGDNAYGDGTDLEYQSAVFDMYPSMLRTSVLWPTLGNHDGHSASSDTQTGPYYAIFTLPTQGEVGGEPSGTEAYYSFDYANIHFICLDSYDTDRSPGGDMMLWLADDLAASNAEWTIAFFHHPPYTKGSHDSDVETSHIDMRENALPILEAGGVDLVLGGHSHAYERSVLINGHYGLSTTLDPAMVLDDGSGRVGSDGAYKKPRAAGAPFAGAVYVVAGASGQTGGGSLDHPIMYLSLATLGSLVLDVDGPRLTARYLGGNGGQVIDSFTMVREDPVTTPSVHTTAPRIQRTRPNPFNPRTVVEVALPMPALAELRIYTLRGELVRSWPRRLLSSGVHPFIWEGRDDQGHDVASGVYLVELRTPQTRDRRKITLLR